MMDRNKNNTPVKYTYRVMFKDKDIADILCSSEKEFASYRVGDICYIEQSLHLRHIFVFKRIKPSEEEVALFMVSSPWIK